MGSTLLDNAGCKAQLKTTLVRRECYVINLKACAFQFFTSALCLYMLTLQHLAARKQLKVRLLGMHLLCEVSRMPNNIALLCAAVFVLPSVFCSCSLWDTSHAKVAQSGCVCFALVMT